MILRSSKIDKHFLEVTFHSKRTYYCINMFSSLFKTDFTKSTAGSLEVAAALQLIKEMSKVHSANVISTSTLKEKYPGIPWVMEPVIRSALVVSPVMVKTSYLAIHFRLYGHVHFGLTEDRTETKKLPVMTQEFQWCQEKKVTLKVQVNSRWDLEKTDVLITLENGIIPAEILLDLALNHLDQHGIDGSLRDGKVMFHFSRGPNHGEKMNFDTFSPLYSTSSDTVNGTSEFKAFLGQVFQEIGWNITNENPSVFSKLYKKKCHHYSLVLTYDNPDIEDWDTCPCYSITCSGAPAFFQNREFVCVNV